MWENFVMKKKKGFWSVHIWIFLSVPYCLVVEKIGIKQIYFILFFLLGNEMDPDMTGLNGARGAQKKKKTHLVNRLGSGHMSGPTGRVQVWKNLAWTQPVAIPKFYI